MLIVKRNRLKISQTFFSLRQLAPVGSRSKPAASGTALTLASGKGNRLPFDRREHDRPGAKS
jgi:hypothetical protein